MFSRSRSDSYMIPPTALLEDASIRIGASLQRCRRPSKIRPASSAAEFLLSRVEIGKLLPQIRHLGRIVINNIGLVRMQLRIILVIRLRRIKRLQRRHLRGNLPAKNFGLIELRNVSLGNFLLLVIPVE